MPSASGAVPARRMLALLAVAALAVSLLVTAGPAADAAPATGRITGTVSGPVTCASVGGPYPDVSAANTHCDNIWWMAGTGITKPTGGRYLPGNDVTRGSMTAFLFRLTHPGKPSPACQSNRFPDVDPSNVFCGYISWAASNGIAFGYDNGTFGPDRPVTRGAMAAFLHRIVVKKRAAKCTATPFSDVPVSDPFCGVISWMKKTGITYGVGGGKYGTTQPVTRQSMASFLRRIVTETTAAPGIGNAQIGPMRGATVVITAADSSGRYYLATTGRDGGYSVSGVAPGSYRVCVDGSTVSPGLPSGYTDRCYRNVAWPWDSPRAPHQSPAVTVRSGATVSGIDTTLPAAATSRHRHRGATPTVATKSDKFTYMQSGYSGRGYIAYSPCQPIHYVINNKRAPAGAAQLIDSAVQRVSQATGLRFIYDGASSETAVLETRPSYQPQRYGQRWAPVLIEWSNPAKHPELSGGVLGYAGSASMGRRDASSNVAEAYLTGQVLLDGPELGAMSKDSSGPNGKALVRATIMHELGHLVGLGHYNDGTQLMNDVLLGGVTTFQAGDLSGLATLGQGPCVTFEPSVAANLLVSPPTGPDPRFLP